MLEEPFVFIDIETNGGSGDYGRIIEVAAIKVVNGEIVDEYQTLVNPGGSIPHWTTSLTGISNSQLAGAPYFADIAQELHMFLDGSVFVAHNVLFDYSFIRRELKAAGYTFAPKLFCTVKMSRALYPEHRGHSLEKIIQRHAIAVDDRHRAYADAKAIYDYTKLTIAAKGVEAFRANVALQLKTKSLPPNVDEKIILDLPESPGVYIFEDDAGAVLYVGKSVNIRSRVRSHFTSATTVAKEMKMSLRSHNVSYITTETEVEALLLESAKVKELQPVFNRKLRRKTTQHIIVKSFDAARYATFAIESRDLSQYGQLQNVYGVFASKSQAKTALDELCRTYQLCPKLLGLEKPKGACFRHQFGLCKGACGGEEQSGTYNARVELALERLKIATWPYPSRVAVAISPARSIVVDQWIALGIYDHENESFSAIRNSFDLDTYKILRTFIRANKSRVKLIDDREFVA